MPPPNPYGMQTLWQPRDIPGLTVAEMCIVQSAIRPRGNTVLLAVTNAGHVALAVNLARSLVQAGTERFLIVALDREALSILQAHGVPTLLARPEWLDMREAQFVLTALNATAEAKYGQQNYNELTRVKHIIVRAFLVQGFTVFFHDVDIAYSGKGAVEEVEDWVHSRHCALALMTDVNELHEPWREWNTGLFIARPRWSTFFLLDGAAYGEGAYDQLAFAAHARQHRAYRRPYRHSILDTGEKMFCSIPNGKRWSTGNWACLPSQPLQAPRLVHANYVIGAANKIKCLDRYGMWGLRNATLSLSEEPVKELSELFMTLPMHQECASD